MFRILLRPKILSLRNSVTVRSAARRAPFVVMGFGFWMAFYLGTAKLLSSVRNIEFLGDVLAEKLFSMILFGLVGFLVLSNVISSLSAFYLSRDVPFLLSKPVETKAIIRLKTFESVLNSSWMVFSFVPPVFIAYGTSYGAPLEYYFLMMAALAMFILVAAGAGISAAHILTRVFPAKRSRDALLALGLFLFLILYFTVKTSVPDSPDGTGDIIASFMRFRTDFPFLPGYWVTKCLFPLLKNGRPGVFYFGLLAGNTAFFLLLSSFIGGRLYRANIEKIQPSAQDMGGGLLKKVSPGRAWAVALKDVRIFFRDTAQWSQMFIIGALIVVYTYNFKSIPVAALAGLSPFFREIMVLINMAMAGLVLSAVAARFLYTSVSLEGRAFWVVRSAPVDMRAFLRQKFLLGSLPLALIISALVFLADSAIGATGVLMAASVGTTCMLSIAVGGLSTGLGAIYPKFRHENPATVSMSLGGMAFMLLAFGVVLITLSLEAWIYYLSARAGAPPGTADMIWIACCILIILAVNATAFWLPMRLGERRLEQDAEF